MSLTVTGLSLSNCMPLSLSLFSHEEKLARNTADALLLLIPQEMSQSGSMMCLYRSLSVCLRTSCQSISLPCCECQKL